MIRHGRKQTDWQPYGCRRFGFCIHGLWRGSPARHPRQEPGAWNSAPPGSVRGVPGNGYPYRDTKGVNEMKLIPAASEATVLKIPLFTESCAAGFPSPAADYTESELDLNEYCISRRHATYFVRAIGNSMTDIGLYSGDLMVVDKAEQPRHGDIVIAEIEGEFTRQTSASDTAACPAGDEPGLPPCTRIRKRCKFRRGNGLHS
ncbi:umuDC operon protein-like protein [Klebsiella pneumoniae]|nr:umuDC operon protein-like protein [Klebsiella pneumoniae]